MSTGKPSRRHLAPTDKVKILKEHLLEREPVSKLCEKYGVNPTQIYCWLKTFFENGEAAFSRVRGSGEGMVSANKIEHLEARLKKKDEVIAELLEEHVELKKDRWGSITKQWVEPHIRDEIVDYVDYWSGRASVPVTFLTNLLKISRSKFYEWKERYGKVNNHNGKLPREWWLLPEERQAILDFQSQHPLEGYRRLTYMMMDADVAAVSATTVRRVLTSEGRLKRWNGRPSFKGKGFIQPLEPHEHWHTDVSHVNVGGTFYYICSVLDGCSRAILAWDIRASMKTQDIQLVIQKALDGYPGVTPRIISDNGPQFVANEFRKFVRFCSMSHVRTSP